MHDEVFNKFTVERMPDLLSGRSNSDEIDSSYCTQEDVSFSNMQVIVSIHIYTELAASVDVSRKPVDFSQHDEA